MKRIFLSTAFAMSVLVVSAQTGTTAANTSTAGYTTRVSTDNEIRQMANQLQLNEGQYIRFRDLSRARNEQLREANNMYANDATALKSRIKTIDKSFEDQLAQTVSQKQFTAYLESQGRGATSPGYQATGYGGSSLEGGAATGTSVNGGAVNTNENVNQNQNTEPNKPQMLNNTDNVNKATGEKRKDRGKNKKNKNME